MKMLKAGSLIFLNFIFLTGCSDFTGNSEVPQKPKGSDSAPPLAKKEGHSSHKANGKELNKKTLVADLVDFAMTPQISAFVESSKKLHNQLTSDCHLEAHSSSAWEKESAIALKYLWKNAMENYHALEVMQIGPLSENNFELLDRVYSYPSTNRCAIDIEVYNMSNQIAYNLPQATNRLGLDAIEHLLFQPNLDHSCAKNSKNLSNWDTLTKPQKATARCNYLKALGRQLSEDVQKIDSQWSNFAAKFEANAEQINENEWLNQIFFALFFIEKNTKDQTLGVPTGLSKALPRCHGRFCLNSIQHKDSKFIKQLLTANLKSFQTLFTGVFSELVSGYGLRDYLLNQNNSFSQRVAQKIETQVTAILTQLNSLPSHYDMHAELEATTQYELCRNSTSVDRKIEACALYQDLKTLTNLLKKELTVALSIQLPVDTEGDGD